MRSDLLGLAAFCNDVEQMLDGHAVVAGHMRAATLQLLVAWPEWPSDRPIRLHTEGGDNSGRRYGPRDPVLGYVESVHVKHRADGRYAAAEFVDVEPDRWRDCGAEADSFFEAILEGLALQVPLDHRQLTERLKSGSDARNTDARWLRLGLLQWIRHHRVAAVQALEPIHANRAQANAKGKVDGQMLREILAMGADRINRFSRWNLSSAYNTPSSSLTRVVSSTGEPTAAGEQIFRREADPTYRPTRFDASGLQYLAECGVRGIEAQFGSLESLAGIRGWSMGKVVEFFDPQLGLTSKGAKRLCKWKEGNSGVPVMPADREAAPETRSCAPPGELMSQAMRAEGIHRAMSPIPIEAPDFQDMLQNMSCDDAFGWASPARESDPGDVPHKRVRLDASTNQELGPAA